MESFLQFAEQNLSLTPADLSMIPVGMVAFFIFWKLMESFVFRPFLELHEKREEATTLALSGSEEVLINAQRIEASFEAQLTEQRIKFAQEKMDTLQKAKKEGERIIADKQMAIEEKALKEREESEQELLAVWKEALKDVESLSDTLAEKVLSPLKESEQSIGE